MEKTIKQKAADILVLLGRIERDKWLHFVGSAVLTLILAPMMGYWAALLVAAVGVGKEFTDRDTTGFSRQDLTADALGILAGIMVWAALG